MSGGRILISALLLICLPLAAKEPSSEDQHVSEVINQWSSNSFHGADAKKFRWAVGASVGATALLGSTVIAGALTTGGTEGVSSILPLVPFGIASSWAASTSLLKRLDNLRFFYLNSALGDVDRWMLSPEMRKRFDEFTDANPGLDRFTTPRFTDTQACAKAFVQISGSTLFKAAGLATLGLGGYLRVKRNRP